MRLPRALLQAAPPTHRTSRRVAPISPSPLCEVFEHKPYGRPVDVYSFAMISYNVLETRAPWAELSGEKAVRAAGRGQRPALPRSCDQRVASLLADAWAPEPVRRPSFAAILDVLQAFPPGDIERPLAVKATQPSSQTCAVS